MVAKQVTPVRRLPLLLTQMTARLRRTSNVDLPPPPARTWNEVEHEPEHQPEQNLSEEGDAAESNAQQAEQMAENGRESTDQTAQSQPATADDTTVTMLSVGTRVVVREGDAPPAGGMLASKRLASLVIAMDDGKWRIELMSDVGSKVVADTTPVEDDFDGVLALAYGQSKNHVSGMLLGGDRQTLLGGKMSAYCSHIARTQSDDRDPRLRGKEGNMRAEEQSFSLGDCVQQIHNTHTPQAFATVVRVLYSPRGKEQARRMLVLLELNGEMKLTFSASNPPIFFPASWLHWTQLEQRETLELEDIKRVEEVRCSSM